MFRNIFQDTRGLTWQAPPVCCVVYRTPWRTAWTTDNTSHHGPGPSPCLKYPGKKTTIWIDYVLVHKKDHPKSDWFYLVLIISRYSGACLILTFIPYQIFLTDETSSIKINIKTYFIILKVSSVQITDTSLYIKWNGQSHQNINNLLQFIITPLTLNYIEIAKQSIFIYHVTLIHNSNENTHRHTRYKVSSLEGQNSFKMATERTASVPWLHT